MIFFYGPLLREVAQGRRTYAIIYVPSRLRTSAEPETDDLYRTIVSWFCWRMEPMGRIVLAPVNQRVSFPIQPRRLLESFVSRTAAPATSRRGPAAPLSQSPMAYRMHGYHSRKLTPISLFGAGLFLKIIELSWPLRSGTRLSYVTPNI
jgi:hypothetical protein